MRNLLLLVLMLGIGMSDLVAQCCSGGVPISSNLGLASKNAGTLQFQLSYDYNTLRDLFIERQRLEDDTRERNTHSVLLETSYDLNDAFSVTGLFSWVQQERIISTLPGQSNLTRNTGIGDGIFLLKYNVITPNINPGNPNRQITVGAGPKIPFGRSDFTDEIGILLPADLQPGTGAWDAIFWGYVAQHNVIRRSTVLTLISTLRLPGTGLRNNGLQQYQFGTEFQAQLGISDRFVFAGLVLDPMLTLQVRTVKQDKFRDDFDANFNLFPNTGGSYLYAVPSININLNPDMAVRASGTLPVYRELIGTQVTTSYKLSLAFYYALSFSKKKSFGPAPQVAPNPRRP